MNNYIFNFLLLYLNNLKLSRNKLHFPFEIFSLLSFGLHCLGQPCNSPLPFLLQVVPGVLHRCTNTVAKRKVTVIKVNLISGVPRGVVWGVQTPPPRNSEDIGGVLEHISKKNGRLDFLLKFTVFSYGFNLLNKGSL